MTKLETEALSKISSGIQNNSYADVESGAISIGDQFNLLAEDIKKDNVTRDTLFQNADSELDLF